MRRCKRVLNLTGEGNYIGRRGKVICNILGVNIVWDYSETGRLLAMQLIKNLKFILTL